MSMRKTIGFVLFILCCMPSKAQERPKLKLGGALRFTYSYADWKKQNKQKGGELGYDVFRLNVDAHYKKFSLAADYRFYAKDTGGNYLRRAILGYQLSAKQKMEFGLIPVPFGIMPALSNNFYLNLNYYLGLEDDDDIGLKYIYSFKEWTFIAAFFKNSDLFGGGEHQPLTPDRYGCDVMGRNQEINTLALQTTYDRKKQHQLGLSALCGGLYNIDTQKVGNRFAGAIHYWGRYKAWDIKAQYTYYKFSPKNKEGESGDIVTLGSFGGTYDIASEAHVYHLGVQYTLNFKKKLIDSIRFYNDFSAMQKVHKGFYNSYENVLGCLVTAGPILVYIDYILAKNHVWIGTDTKGLAAGNKHAAWHSKLNINIGYYF